MLNSTATKILFDENNRAVGVEFVHNGMVKRVSVLKEVVVSGGKHLNKLLTSIRAWVNCCDSIILSWMILSPVVHRRKIGKGNYGFLSTLKVLDVSWILNLQTSCIKCQF
jgi:hypothetical protein